MEQGLPDGVHRKQKRKPGSHFPKVQGSGLDQLSVSGHDGFFPNRAVKNGHQDLDINHFRKRELPEGYRACPEAYLQKLELRKYAYNTARTYISLFEGYINYYADRELIELDEGDVHKYLQHLVQQKKSGSYLNQAVNAIKFYYEVVMGMPNCFYSIERPRKQEKLPEVLSKDEIKRMIEVTKNLKHQCIISLLYSTGLRRGELLNLKINDIDSQAKIKRRVYPHILRHSFATAPAARTFT